MATSVQAENERQSKEGEDIHFMWCLLLEVRKTQPARQEGGRRMGSMLAGVGGQVMASLCIM